MINLKIARQTFDFDCGAKVLQTVMAYYGVEVREDELMKELHTNSDGTSVANIVKAAQDRGFEVYKKNGFPLEEVKRFVDEGHPVMVVLQAWADRYMTLADWKEDYDDGHYAVVIGHQNGIIIFEDPASFRRTWLSEEEFLVRWHDMDAKTGKKYEHFGMVLIGKVPAAPAVEHMD